MLILYKNGTDLLELLVYQKEGHRFELQVCPKGNGQVEFLVGLKRKKGWRPLTCLCR